jgi:hypothetical protein
MVDFLQFTFTACFRENFLYYRRLSDQLLEWSQALSKNQNKLTEEGYWKDFSQFVYDFREASRNFCFGFFKKRQPKIVKTNSAHSKTPIWFLGPSRKIFISWHYPFKHNKIRNMKLASIVNR